MFKLIKREARLRCKSSLREIRVREGKENWVPTIITSSSDLISRLVLYSGRGPSYLHLHVSHSTRNTLLALLLSIKFAHMQVLSFRSENIFFGFSCLGLFFSISKVCFEDNAQNPRSVRINNSSAE